jgi:hypothetical protein
MFKEQLIKNQVGRVYHFPKPTLDNLIMVFNNF